MPARIRELHMRLRQRNDGPRPANCGDWCLSLPFGSRGGEGEAELVASADCELGKDLAQVVFDGPSAHEELRCDFGVGKTVGRELGDLSLSGGELGRGAGGVFAYSHAGGTKLTRGTFSESVGSHGHEHPVCSAQLLAGVGAPVLAA
jgi:hypothetical protein